MKKEYIFEWKYEGSNKELLDKSIDLKIYLPKKVQSVKYKRVEK